MAELAQRLRVDLADALAGHVELLAHFLEGSGHGRPMLERDRGASLDELLAGLAGSHDADVGPWKKYLGMLLRRTDPAAVAG